MTAIANKSLLRRLLSGTAVVAAGRIIGVFANFLLAAVLARLLQPADMGAYFLTFSLANFLCILARAGSEQVALKLFADRINGAGSDRLVAVARKFAVIVTAASLLVAVSLYVLRGPLFLGLFNSSLLYGLVFWLILWAFSLAVQAVVAEIFRAFKDFVSASLFRGPLASVLTVTFLGAWLLQGRTANLHDVMLIIVGMQMLVNAVAMLMIWRKAGRFDRQGSASAKAAPALGYMAVMSMAMPLCVNQLAMYIAAQSDLWILQAMGNATMVAHYGAAARLVLFSTLALQIANAVLPPYISQLRLEGDNARMQQVLRFVATIAAVPALIVTLIFVFFSQEVLGLVFGSGYEAGATVLLLLSLGQLVNVLVGSCGYVLVMYGRGALLMRISLISGALAILSSATALKVGLGMNEVAACYMVVMWGQQTALLLLARRVSGVYTHAGVFRIKAEKVGS